MKILKYFNILIYLFVYLSSANAFTDKEGKGAQSTGKEDLSFLETKTSNFKKVSGVKWDLGEIKEIK